MATLAQLAYNHYAVRSDGAKWKNGVRNDSLDTSWLSVTGSSVHLQAGVYDELLVVPYLAPESEVLSWFQAQAPMEAIPTSTYVNSVVGAGILYGPEFGRPAPGVADRLYVATNAQRIWRDDGTQWVLAAGVPKGAIQLWYGSIASIPTGWVLCDGRTYTAADGTQITTPDLRDRFVVGAGSAYSVGATGGAAQVTLDIIHLPPHDHGGATGAWGGTTAEAGAHSHRVGRNEYLGGPETVVPESLGTGRGDDSLYYPTSTAGAHSHSIPSHTHAIASQGGGQAHENRPPYYALAFIMKL